MIRRYTIIVFTENKTGVLHRVVGIISRRHINIESLTVSNSAIAGIHKLTFMLDLDDALISKLVAQIDKQIDIIKAFYYKENEIIRQEIALYKVPTEALHNSNHVERLIRKHNAKILRIEKEYIVVEKTGHQKETEALLTEFGKIGIYEFVRSGQVAIVKQMETLNKYLKSIENSI